MNSLENSHHGRVQSGIEIPPRKRGEAVGRLLASTVASLRCDAQIDAQPAHSREEARDEDSPQNDFEI